MDHRISEVLDMRVWRQSRDQSGVRVWRSILGSILRSILVIPGPISEKPHGDLIISLYRAVGRASEAKYDELWVLEGWRASTRYSTPPAHPHPTTPGTPPATPAWCSIHGAVCCTR